MRSPSTLRHLRNPFLFFFVLPGTFLYIFVVQIRNRLYQWGFLKSYRSRYKIISVGNLTWGGTGKSPVVQKLAQDLADKKLRVAVVLRSYKAQAQQSFEVTVESSAELVGDEALNLKRQNPNLTVISGPSKTKSVQWLEQSQLGDFDFVIIDDGLQHRQLVSDFKILLLDVSVGLDEYRWAPFGRLRENFEEVFDVNAVFLTNAQPEATDTEKWIRGFFTARIPDIPFWRWQGSLEIPTGGKTKKVGLISGIARPENFERMMKEKFSDLTEEDHLIFADHQVYQDKELSEIRRWIQLREIQQVFCTEKDFVKLGHLSGENFSLRPVKYSLMPDRHLGDLYAKIL